MDHGEFFVSMSVTDRRVHLSWEVIIVYDPADHGCSANFLAELKNKVERCTTPVVVAGDFNLIRWTSGKNSPNVDRPRKRLFNDCIADLALREIARVEARFTWSNKQADPIRSVLDRVFVLAQWEVMFPLCSLKADGDVLLESPEDISSRIYSFYKELFPAEPRGGTSLCEHFWPLADEVSDMENVELTLPFSPEEVGQAIASIKACSAPGPDGLPVVFFQ
ncbi:retrotransposon unclassified [Hordeum vulgare]|nr:retrotransposon unclassified [Hordeum vulgare]